ncbi:MAG: hypothetical protein AAF975_02240 [Spirochaetota bacterium]
MYFKQRGPFFYLLLIWLSAAPLFAELEQTRQTLLDNGKPVLLQAIDIQVKGLSNKNILRNRLGIREGDKFQNLTELRTILNNSFDGLKGTGYFTKGGITYRLIREDDDSLQSIRLEAEFQDAWTIYPIVYPYYSTSSGYGLRGRLRWDNFLGLLGKVTFAVNAYEVRGGKYGLDWDGGLSIGTIKLSPNLGLNGSFTVKHDARTDGANGYMGLGLGASLSLNRWRSAGIRMGYSFSNSSGGTFGYTGKISKRPYFATGFSHSFSLSNTRTTWGGVLIDGYSMSLANHYSFDSDVGNLSSPQALALEDIQFNFTMKLSRSYFHFINFKGRAGMGKSFDFANGKYNSGGYNYNISSYNRGKRSGAVKGNFVIFLNMDMALLVFRDSLLGDLLLEPFLDVTWMHNASGFRLETASLGSGFELIWVFHSLKFRFTFGFDLHQPKLYTIGITTGFYF